MSHRPEAVDPAQRSLVLVATFIATATVAQLVFGKAARDALFLSSFDVKVLPHMMIAAAVVSFLSVLGLSRAMTLLSPYRVVPASFAASAIVIVLVAWLSVRMPRVAAIALYLQLAALGATVVSCFWSLINELYDPHTAKRVVGKIAAGATAGAILGSALAWQSAEHLDTITILTLMAAVNALCFCASLLLRPHPSKRREADQQTTIFSGLRLIRRMPYLRHLAIVVMLAAVMSALIDYLLSARVVSTYTTSSSLMSFFGQLQLAMGVLSFLLLTFMSRPSLKYLGLAGTVALLPGLLGVGAVAALAAPGLATAVALKATEGSLAHSLYRSGYELLFTPLPPSTKRSSKLIIDVAFDRVGTSVGSAIAAVVVALAATQSEIALTVIIGATAVAVLWTSRKLHAGYVHALEQSLLDGSAELGEPVITGMTWHTLTQTNLHLDRHAVLAEIERMRQDATLRSTDAAPASMRAAESAVILGADPIVQAIVQLRSGQSALIRRCLEAQPVLPLELVAHVTPLLAMNEVARDVVRALRSVAPRASGQLIDALLDPATSPLVRRRLPRVLKECTDSRTAAGLVRGLHDKVFDVRQQCALALVSIRDREPKLQLPEAEILQRVIDEMEVDRSVWGTVEGSDSPSEDGLLLQDVLSDRKNRRLAHVFTMLSLVLERGPLMLAFRGHESSDPHIRGTSLEYLENVLPPPVRERLDRHLGHRRAAPIRVRPREQVLDELLASATSLSPEDRAKLGLRR